ncbi:MAG: hypothetical protein M1829_000575 [Trizodia sp. TS-e1964]|nr:MAG: hypothetical protein M1829_000575 [Trizodia sp. TS-e1964]
MHIPSSTDYPGISQNLFQDIKSTILNGVFGNSIKILSTETKKIDTWFRCTLTYQALSRDPVSVSGEDIKKSLSEKTAYAHMLAQLHKSGLLKEIIGEPESVDNEFLKDQTDAIEDVYNYAARFETIPKYSYEIMDRLILGRKKRIIQVTIELPEQSIKVSASSTTMRTAEITASFRFKQAAEKLHANKGIESMFIKDLRSVNTDNAPNFISFYKSAVGSSHFTIVNDPYSGTLKDTHYRAQAFLDGDPLGPPVVSQWKKKAEKLAYLVAAITLRAGDPALSSQFQQAIYDGNGEFIKPLSPIRMFLDEDTTLRMQETLVSARTAGLPDIQGDPKPTEPRFIEAQSARYRLPPSIARARSIELKSRYDAYHKNPYLQGLWETRESLPINQHKLKVLELVENNIYSIIVGSTGSGKTTQVPQILLDNAISNGSGGTCDIICTQPRRIAASSVARRVSSERSELLQKSVGYHVRFDAKLPEIGGSITYCTAGILLQQLHHIPDTILDSVSHLIIDEVHERSIVIDFLLVTLKRAIERRIKLGMSVPKVVLMSATLNTDLFAKYLRQKRDDGTTIDCPLITVPGRTFSVKEHYLETILNMLDEKGSGQTPLYMADPPTKEYLKVEKQCFPVSKQPSNQNPEETEAIIDWKSRRVINLEGVEEISREVEDSIVPIGLIVATIAHITKTTSKGSILVFLPGMDEIINVQRALHLEPSGVRFSDETKFKIKILHSTLPLAPDDDIFLPSKDGCQKIILSTNIAESSVTIPDVVHVIDSGKVREKQYDPIRRVSKLQVTWISQSNCKQRAGRAGRVQEGNYYAIFSKERYNSMRPTALPEMLRCDLQETCLDIKVQSPSTSIRDYLSETLDPPPSLTVDSSIFALQALGALSLQEELTPLGRILSKLPVHPSLGKMIILGIIFRCLDPIIILSSAAYERSIFQKPAEKRSEVRQSYQKFVDNSKSDHIAIINAFRTLRNVNRKEGYASMLSYSYRHFLHRGVFKSIDQTAHQIVDILTTANLIPRSGPRHDGEYGHQILNINSNKLSLIKAIALAGMPSNIAFAKGGKTLRTRMESLALIHKHSANALPSPKASHPPRTFYYYSQLSQNAPNAAFLRDTTECSALTVALFGGQMVASDRILKIESWLPLLPMSSYDNPSKTLLEFRKALDRLLNGAFMALSSPQTGEDFIANVPARDIFAEGLTQVLEAEMRQNGDLPVNSWLSSSKKETMVNTKDTNYHNLEWNIDEDWRELLKKIEELHS